MASLQLRSGSWRVIFRHNGLQHFVTVGEVEETEAQGVKARYEYLLRLLKQRLLTMPAGMDIVTFLRLDGKLTNRTCTNRKHSTLGVCKPSLKGVRNADLERT